jgi:hypothetical protein
MGLLTTYLAYKYGKRRAEERAEQEAFDSEVCDSCGYERRDHKGLKETCPA